IDEMRVEGTAVAVPAAPGQVHRLLQEATPRPARRAQPTPRPRHAPPGPAAAPAPRGAPRAPPRTRPPALGPATRGPLGARPAVPRSARGGQSPPPAPGAPVVSPRPCRQAPRHHARGRAGAVSSPVVEAAGPPAGFTVQASRLHHGTALSARRLP